MISWAIFSASLALAVLYATRPLGGRALPFVTISLSLYLSLTPSSSFFNSFSIISFDGFPFFSFLAFLRSSFLISLISRSIESWALQPEETSSSSLSVLSTFFSYSCSAIAGSAEAFAPVKNVTLLTFCGLLSDCFDAGRSAAGFWFAYICFLDEFCF